MIKTAFSTVACPEWTLHRVARAAAEYGYDGVELRTFGFGSTEFACEPALTGAAKVRELFAGEGVRIASLGTSARFDEPIRPPVIGRVLGDPEAPVRRAKVLIDLAAQIEAPFVRVFAFEHSKRENRRSAVARIVERLKLAVDAARNTGVRLVLENGGSFPRGVDILELIEAVDDPLLGAGYSIAAAHPAGEAPAEGVAVLRSRLWFAKVKDFRGTRACPLGEGDLPGAALVEALSAARFTGWLVFEWDRAWLPDLEPADEVLPSAARTLYQWLGQAAVARRSAVGA